MHWGWAREFCRRPNSLRRSRSRAGRDAGYRGPAVHGGQRHKGVPSDCRAGETADRAEQDARCVGLQRERAGTDDRDHEGDRVRIIVDNRLPEPTRCTGTVEVPIDMDGGAWDQPGPDSARRTLHLRVHAASARHVLLPLAHGDAGNDGHDRPVHHPPEAAYAPHVDNDFGIILQEWAVLPNNTVPNTMAMEFNWLTFNGKAGRRRRRWW